MAVSKLACKTIPAAHSYGRRTARVCKITPHHMAGNLTIEGCGAVFQTREASSNYGIGSDGRIACYVDEDCGAWTSSSFWNDNQAVTIEVANTSQGVSDGTWAVSDAAWASLVELCADICRRHGFRLVYTGGTDGSLTEHLMYSATACPGPFLHARMARLAAEVNKILDGGEEPGPFGDVGKGTPHADDISWAKERGIAKGYPDGTFRPLEPVVRADMAAFLHRLAGSPRRFKDVSAGTAHAFEIGWMAEQGISEGYPDGTFRPGAPVKRCDLAAFLYRQAGSPHFEPTEADRAFFSDVDDGTPHAREIWWLASVGITEGWTSGGRHWFKPLESVARCDAMAMLRRAAG